MEYEYRDILKDPLTPAELMKLSAHLDGGIKALLNMRSRTLKDLQVDTQAMSDADVAQLLSDNPKTMIRPLYLKDDALVVGFDEARLESLL